MTYANGGEIPASNNPPIHLDNSYIIPKRVVDQLGEPGLMKQLNEARPCTCGDTFQNPDGNECPKHWRYFHPETPEREQGPTITYRRWLPGDSEP